MKTQLLCTFSDEGNLDNTLKNINNSQPLFSKKIFVLKLELSDELVISYNIIPNENIQFLPNTIMVHRKKESNTIYTINALNKLITYLNGGVLNKSYQLNWNNFSNSIILTDNDSYKIIKTKLFLMIDVN